MKKYLLITPVLLLALLSCTKAYEPVSRETVKVHITNAVTDTNSRGEQAYDFCAAKFVGFATDASDRGAAMAASESIGEMDINAKVAKDANLIWCYSPGAIYDPQQFTVASSSQKTSDTTIDDFSSMLYCSNAGVVKDGAAEVKLYPLTSGVSVKVVDSEGKLDGYTVSGVKLEAEDGIVLAGNVTLDVKGCRIASIADSSSVVSVVSEVEGGLKVGSAELGLVTLPGAFKGTVTVWGPEFTAIMTISTPLYLQTGYIASFTFDIAVAETKSFPKKVGVLGDSISTYEGYIPAGYSKYYPNTNAACSDVNAWTKTYWGQLITEYWHASLDVNSSWSGGCVAPGSTRGATPFTIRCKDFIDPDVILLFGGTNDCQSSCAVALGDFDFDSPVGALDCNAKFRQSYIAVVRTIQARYPKAQIIVIIGNHIDGEYATSVETIAKHFELPIVDFRNDRNVTVYEQLHPNAAGHAYMAKKIFETTIDCFK